jgi:hypothetical protein
MKMFRITIETENYCYYTFDFWGNKETFWTEEDGVIFGKVSDMWALCVGKFGIEDEEEGGLLDIIQVEDAVGDLDLWTITEEELLA